MLIFGNLYDLGTYPSLIFDIFRYIFFFIDGIIYSLIPWVYGAMYNLYDLRMLFNDNGQVLSNLVSNLSKTIYSFLALFMFFKTAVSLLTMLIDPSKIADKEKGASKIILNIFLCLVLIVAVPKVFDVARSIQTKVMENHIIEKLVISEDFGDNERYTLGHELSLSLWSVFLAPATDGTNSTTQKAYDSLFNNQDALGMGAIWPISKVLVVLNATSGIPIASDIIGKIFGGVNNLLNVFGIGTHYQLSYVWLLSTIAGGWVLWAFVKMMIDIAYRSIKLFMLELLSPIAIISYIDPASSKNGLFSKWLKETWKTYLSLFARIFVFAIVSILLRTFKLSSISGGGLSVKLFFILAAVAFFKNAPKLIDDMFGTTISKNDISKLALEGFGSLMGRGVGMVAGGISGAVSAKAAGKSALWGATSGAWQGGAKGASEGKKSLVGVVTGGYGTYKEQQKRYGTESDMIRDSKVRTMKAQYKDIKDAKNAEVLRLQTNPDIITNNMGRSRNTNGYTYDFSYISNDAVARGNYIKMSSGNAQERRIPGLSEAYYKYKEKEREASYEASQAELMLTKAKSIEATYTSKSLAEQEQILNNNVPNWQTVFGTADVTQAIDLYAEQQVRIQTGQTVDVWENVASKLSSDAKDAAANTEAYLKSAAGKKDSEIMSIFKDAKAQAETGV